jgi:DNA (cytosine-5)-methyltransferase 1
LTHGGRVSDAARPFPTITGAHRGELGICEPFVLSQASGGAPRPVSEPMPTICADGATALVDASFIVPNFGERPTQRPRTHAVDEPLPSITSHGAGCLVEARACELPPFMVPPRHMNDGYVDDVERPLRTITAVTGHQHAVVEPFLTKYYGTGISTTVNEPLDTITARDRFGLCTPLVFKTADGGLVALDIRFRMLQPHELAAGMSFDADYQFAGNKGDQIKQIGNAVPGELARALCRAQLAPIVGKRATTDPIEAVA